MQKINSHIILNEKKDAEKLAEVLERNLKKRFSASVTVKKGKKAYDLAIHAEDTSKLEAYLQRYGIVVDFPSGRLVFQHVNKVPSLWFKEAGFRVLHLRAVERSEHFYALSTGSLKTVRTEFKETYNKTNSTVEISVVD